MANATWLCVANPSIRQAVCDCVDCVSAVRQRQSEANARKYAKHRERYLAQQKAYRVANAKRIAARRRANYRANPEPQRQRALEYARANPRDPIAARDANKAYRNANRSRVAARQRLRSSRKSGNTPDGLVVTERDWRRLVARYGGRCAYCGTAGKMTQDHVIPLARGGRHSIGNLLPACGGCNCSKHARFIIEWRANRRGLPQKR